MNNNVKDLINNNPDLAAYFSGLNTSYTKEIETLKHEVKSLDSNNKLLQQEVETLQFTLSKINRSVFGKKSEKSTNLIEEVRNLFNFNEAEENQNLNAVEPTIEKVTKKRKDKALRGSSFKQLESKEVIYDLVESEKVCKVCNTHLVSVGSKTRETIEIIQKAIKKLEKSITYKCPHCESFHKNNFPTLPISGSIASPSLLAQVIVDKTANALPLYRQSEDYKRIGLSLSRQTMSNWMIKSSLLLEVISNKMKSDLMKKDIVHGDETTCQVLKESGKRASQKSYMWTYVSSKYDEPIVIYEYQSSRAGKHAKEFLKDFQGYLHVDGYKGYNQVEQVTLVHCMAHLKRKFFDIYVTLPQQQQLNSNTQKALFYCNKIYDLDKQSRDLSIEERGHYKKIHIKPLMIEFKDWLEEKQLTSAPQSSYGKAIQYAVNYLPSIMNYLEDGRLELDNNRAERAIKPFVIGRKNFLFSNTPNGAESTAILYSIVQTCLLNFLNPYKYLAHVLHVLANHKINEINLKELMPYSENMIKQFQMIQE